MLKLAAGSWSLSRFRPEMVEEQEYQPYAHTEKGPRGDAERCKQSHLSAVARISKRNLSSVCSLECLIKALSPKPLPCGTCGFSWLPAALGWCTCANGCSGFRIADPNVLKPKTVSWTSCILQTDFKGWSCHVQHTSHILGCSHRKSWNSSTSKVAKYCETQRWS